MAAHSDGIGSEDPLEIFGQWLADAERSELNDPNAAALATATADAVPSVRMVLVKRIQTESFCFFTNADSRKGRELQVNRHAALCFHWKSLRRQVRIDGIVHDLGSTEADAYFHSRSRKSQIGAAVSDQSRVLTSRAELEERVERFTRANPGVISRPAYWRGFRLAPERIEFWISGDDRLHDRFLFTRAANAWQKVRLFP